MTSRSPSPTPPGVPIPYPNTGTSGDGWVLFFDEADALFGKRTGVRSWRN